MTKKNLCRKDLSEFLFEDINLVQKQDDGCPTEPSRVNDGLEQNQALLHAVLHTYQSADHEKRFRAKRHELGFFPPITPDRTRSELYKI